MSKRKAVESNPFLAELRAAQASLPRAPRVLDASLADDARAELWNAVCEAGDALREKYAWACPDERALRALAHFAPGGVVEIGAGRGYWAKLLRELVAVALVPPFSSPAMVLANCESSPMREVISRRQPWRSAGCDRCDCAPCPRRGAARSARRRTPR